MTSNTQHDSDIIEQAHKAFFLLAASGIVFLIVQYLYSYHPMNLNAVLSFFFALGVLVFYNALKNISWHTRQYVGAHRNERLAVKGEQLMFLYYALGFILLSFMVDVSPDRLNALGIAALTLVSATAIIQALTHTYVFTRFCIITIQVTADKK